MSRRNPNRHKGAPKGEVRGGRPSKDGTGGQPSTGVPPPLPTGGPTGAAAAALSQPLGSPPPLPPSPPVRRAAIRRRDRRKKWWLRRWVGFKRAVCSFWDYYCNKGPKRAFVLFGLLFAGLLLLLGTIYKDEFLQMTPTYQDQATLIFNTSLVIGATLIGILMWWKATRKLCFSLIALYLMGWIVLKVIILLWNFIFVPTGWRVKYSDVTENRYTPWSAPAEVPPTPAPAEKADTTPAPVVVAEHSPSGLITNGRFDPVQGNIYTVICDPGEGRRIEVEFFKRIDEPGETVQRFQRCTPAGYKDVPLAEAKNSFAKATRIEWSKTGEPPPGGDVRRELAPVRGGSSKNSTATRGSSNPPPKVQVLEDGGPDGYPLLPPLPDDILLPEDAGGEAGGVALTPPTLEL